MSARGRVAAAPAAARGSARKQTVIEDEPEEEPVATQRNASKFLKRSGHGVMGNSQLSPKNFDVRLHRCVAQKDTDSGLRVGDFTGNWMVAISTPVGPPNDRAKWLGAYKSAVDTARLGQKHTYVECFPLLGSFNTFCALLHIT